jgi:hypothetical protein
VRGSPDAKAISSRVFPSTLYGCEPVDVPALVQPQAVQRVDVIRIPAESIPNSFEWVALPGDVLATVEGPEAQSLVARIAALPDGEQMRCFTPRYGLRIWGSELVLAETALCFRCHNALTLIDGQRGWFTFDADSGAARQLRAELEHFDPDPIAIV